MHSLSRSVGSRTGRFTLLERGLVVPKSEDSVPRISEKKATQSSNRSTDELAIIEVLADASSRLQQGRDVYGPLDVSTDSRDFLREAYEEILDFSVYISARLVQLMRLER